MTINYLLISAPATINHVIMKKQFFFIVAAIASTPTEKEPKRLLLPLRL